MSGSEKISALILAAGKGTRMKSDLVKVLHLLNGKPLLTYSLNVARAVGAEKIVVIVGHQADLVREQFKHEEISFVEQVRQLGTGHAVLQAKGQFDGYRGAILILCGDVPCLKVSTVKSLIARHFEEKAAVTVMSIILDDPGSYGRVVTAGNGEVLKIVEARDASLDEKKIREINTGIYCADGRFLFDAVSEIRNDNAQGEYYLTDIIEIARKKYMPVRSFIAHDAIEVMGINTPEDLERARCHQTQAEG
jgi:UDP-N-acetylglucosamine diphosphorylase/glucosamine-1-phosphate N-acetyltransferase